MTMAWATKKAMIQRLHIEGNSLFVRGRVIALDKRGEPATPP
jgi:hypothetical protein